MNDFGESGPREAVEEENETAMVIWHFYDVHRNPEVLPMRQVWIHGRISLEALKTHHPLEDERRVERGELPAMVDEDVEGDETVVLRAERAEAVREGRGR